MKSEPLQKLEFCDSFIVGNKASGVVLPPICFTAHPFFLPANSKSNEFRALLQKYDIQWWQFQHSEQFERRDKKGNLPKWTAEHKDLTALAILLWTKHWRRQFGCVQELIFFTDNGNSWKSGSDSIFEIFGARDHIFFKSEIHAHLSTLDNGANNGTKGRYHAERQKNMFSYGDPEARFFMIHAAMNFNETEIQGYWNNNLMLDVQNVFEMTKEETRKRFHKSSEKWGSRHDDCLYDYEIFMENKRQDESMPVIGSPKLRDYSQNGPKVTAPPTRKLPSYLQKSP